MKPKLLKCYDPNVPHPGMKFWGGHWVTIQAIERSNSRYANNQEFREAKKYRNMLYKGTASGMLTEARRGAKRRGAK